MTETIKLSQVRSRFDDLSYPVTRDDAAASFADATVSFADGEANLGKLISEMGSDAFGTPDELFEELQSTMPIEAVGEPGQSEGDA